MNSTATCGTKRAFTLLELLVVVVIVGILAYMVLPAITDRGCSPPHTICMSNLRQVSLALMLYAQDHKEDLPWHTSNANGDKTPNLEASAANHFARLTQYLHSPKLYVCPADSQRNTAPTNFFGFSNSNLSYFASLDVSLKPAPTNVVNLILSGDRHLAHNNQPLTTGLFSATNRAVLSWTEELHWVKNQKETLGVLAFADGHCEAIKATSLPATFQHQNLVITRLMIP